jgi:hypothetical protein
MPEEAHVIQWRERADRVTADASQAYDALITALPSFQAAAASYPRALQHYALVHARDAERQMLLELAKGAGRRQTTFSQRNEVADAQFRSEEQIHLVNRQIYYCQFLIGIGKLAEAGLGVYGWIPKVKGTVDGMKRIVDAAKAVQPIAAEVVAATTGGRSNATAANAAAVTAQLLAIMMRFDDDLRALGTLVWNNVGAIRRATSIKDAWTKASAIAHALKTVLDNLKQWSLPTGPSKSPRPITERRSAL